MVFLHGIAASALIPLQDQPDLQRIVVWFLVISASTLTAVVSVLISGFAIWKPGLLFNPNDIWKGAHVPLYAPGVPLETAPPAEGVTIS
jgi:hypothetical protein